MTKEQELKNLIIKLQISKEEAEELYKADHEDIILPEVAEMERKAKQIKRYEKSNTPRKKTEREYKINPDKMFLLNLLYNGIDADAVELGAKKNDTEFYFNYNGFSYTVKLIRHRPPKKQVVFLFMSTCGPPELFKFY